MADKIKSNDRPDNIKYSQDIDDKDKQNQEYQTIYVNKEGLHIKEHKLTGKQILAYAGLDTNEYDLFLVQGQNSLRIQYDKPYEIKDKMQFHAILKSVPYG